MMLKSNWIRILALCALSCAAHGGAQPADPAVPRGHDLLLFGANWCAPCLAELRELPALADAATPGRIVLVWEDGLPRKLWPTWPDNAVVGSPARAAPFVGDEELSAGLPYAVLLDGEGRRCAVLKGKLTTQRAARMRERCRRGG